MKNKENTLGANKQMAFLNTTKLAVALKRTLMVLTLCIISTLCIQAEESTTEAPDSVTVSGPKKSHWTTKDYIMGFIPYTQHHNNIDYAQVIAKIQVFDGTNDITSTVGNVGTVIIDKPTTSGTIETNLPFDKDSKSAYIYWNCGIQGSNTDKEKLEAAHKLTIELKVTDEEGDDFVFDRWEKQINNGASEDLRGAVDIPLTQTCIIGGGGTGFTGYGNEQNNTYENTGNRYTVTYIAKFIPRKTECKVTFAAAKGGGGYTFQNGTDASTAATGQTVTLDGKTQTILTTPPSNDNELFAWYVSYDEGATYSILSKTTPYTCTFEKDAIVYAQFIPSDAALFIIKDGDGTEYWNLNEACEKAKYSGSKVVLPKADGTLYPLVDGELCTDPEGKTVENYTIPGGVTLLIPYESTNKVNTNTPEVDDATSISTISAYRTLTISSGVKITVNGSICVNAKIRSWQNTNGAQYNKTGVMYIEEGSTITLNSGANLYCWGIIHGDGEITAEGGSFVYESFQINDYPGGTWMTGQISNLKNKDVFPMRIFCFPNIQSKLHLKSGATEKVATAFANLGLQKDVVFISSDAGLFVQESGSVITKWYDKANDLQKYKVNGQVNLKSVELEVGGAFGIPISVNSADFTLPITHNMYIELSSGSTANITENIAFLPGAKVVVKEGAMVNINSDNIIQIYDVDQWKNNYTFANGANKSVIYKRTKTISYDKTKGDLKDAVFEVNGTINIKGALYTTSSGADICSTGAGQVVFEVAAPTNSTAEQVIQGEGTKATYEPISMISALLHNDEGKNPTYHYTQTAGSEAKNTYTYDSELGRWRCKRTITWNANGGTIEPTTTIVGRGEPLSLYFSESLPIPTKTGYTFVGWFTEKINGTQITTETIVDNNVTYYAQWTLNIVGTPLDIVDADNTNQTLTINANGWASSGWPYTINGTPYEKTARKADRTLVIPYSEEPNADMPIVVKDQEGNIISSHIYKVPFLYNTSNATLSGTDANRIVFVKSGTLTVDDASAKEIYVAPGAELKVTGTLTVGKLVLRTTPWQSAVLTIENGGKIEEGGQVYYSRISPDSEQYYQFGLPLSCPLANVKMSNTDKLGGSQPKYGTAWILKSYNEKSRANNGISSEGANWDLLPSNGTITAGVGYEMFSNSNYYREFYFPVTLPAEPTTIVSVSYTPDGAEGAAHAGWNIITSPLTSKATVTIGDPATAIKVCWLQADGSYKQEQPTVIPPAIPFSYQASAGDKELNFSVSSTAAAPRKQSAAEALTETEWVHLDIYDTYGEGDETSLFVHPTRFEQTYKTGIDVAKQSLTAARLIIYSTHAYGDMAFAGIADSLLENGIDLVVYSPAEQKLTFSLRENKFLHRLEYLWLADNETGARTDLLMNDYTCRANAGTIKGRFVLNGRFKAPQISTGIGNTQTDYNIYAIGNNIAISGVEQGTPIYVFDAVGHMIYTTAATSDEVIVPAPCAGVYMLTIGGQTAKLVINQ